MTTFYLWLNSIFYFGVAIWSTLRGSIDDAYFINGFRVVDGTGNEYEVLYGGMQLGISCFYAYLAQRPACHRVGIIFSILIYGFIDIYRLVGMLGHIPVNQSIINMAVIEVAMLAGAFIALLNDNKKAIR